MRRVRRVRSWRAGRACAVTLAQRIGEFRLRFRAAALGSRRQLGSAGKISEPRLSRGLRDGAILAPQSERDAVDLSRQESACPHRSQTMLRSAAVLGLLASVLAPAPRPPPPKEGRAPPPPPAPRAAAARRGGPQGISRALHGGRGPSGDRSA